jgi:hypothetical protein
MEGPHGQLPNATRVVIVDIGSIINKVARLLMNDPFAKRFFYSTNGSETTGIWLKVELISLAMNTFRHGRCR